ncbi:MAG: hypothetical protein ACYTX0_24485 [Nostoc sp.]
MATKGGRQLLRNSFHIEQFGLARITVDERENILAMILGGG